MGWFAPSRIATSISSAVAKPSASDSTASLIIGSKIRLTTKPGLSLTVTRVLLSCSATRQARCRLNRSFEARERSPVVA